jgi:phosphatidylserine decarboxylase
MKNSDKAQQVAQEVIARAFVFLLGILIILLAGTVTGLLGSAVGAVFIGLLALWIIFVAFAHYFFRDPDPCVPAGPNLIVSPGHGKVDVIDETTEPEFMGGPCQRISIFLSVFDVHVQNAPVDGRVAFFKYKQGQFLNALRTDCASVNENVLIGFEPKARRADKLGVRLVAGVIARRIVPWVAAGEEVARGERISLIQFGSRVEVYLPRSAKIKVKLGDRVVGGESVIAVSE